MRYEELHKKMMSAAALHRAMLRVVVNRDITSVSQAFWW